MKDADCPLIKKYLHEVLHTEDYDEVVKFLGFLLINDYKYHKILVLVGPTHTGKTRFILLIYKFLGGKAKETGNPFEPDPNISTITLQDLDREKFSVSDLFGKIANLADDMPAVSVREAGMIKALTGESPVRARRIYEKPFNFINTAKFIFACNNLPICKKADDAYYGRFLIIPFTNMFLPGEKADRNLIEKMTTPQEMSGLLNLAIEGRRLLLASNKLGSMDINEIKEKYFFWSDERQSSLRFVSKMVVIDENLGGMVKSEFYNAYVEFCQKNKLIVRDESAFFRDIRARLSIEARTYHPQRLNRETGLNERVWIIRGVRLKTPEELESEG